ncbi:MAG: hypothetical protein ACQEQ1_06605 [Pseudomonadota bacterium]
MTRLIDRPEHDGAEFTGTYLLSGLRNSSCSDILILELSDCSATVEALYLPQGDAPALHTWQQLSCHLSVDRNRDFRRFLKVEQLSPGPAQLTLGLLPNAACPAPQSLRQLVQILDEAITHPPLRQFIDNAFAHIDTALTFLRVPASASCHHTQAGGLLVHTLDLVESLRFNLRAYPCHAQRQCAIIAGLFHDFGKLARSLIGDTPFYSRDHAQLNAMLLEPALLELRHSCPESWKLIHFMLSALSGGVRTDRVPAAALIQMLDRYSASASAMNNAFEGLAKSQTTASLGYHPQYPTRHYERSPLPDG